MMASSNGHTATAQALIGAGADLNMQDKVSGELCWFRRAAAFSVDAS
jgi:hypothetical protein